MKHVILTLTALVFALCGQAQTIISQQQSSQWVLDSIVGSDSISVNVYADPDMQTKSHYAMTPYDSISSPYATYWLYFIDDKPNQCWGHDCRYVFVDCFSGDIAVVPHHVPILRYDTRLEALSLAVTHPSYPIPHLFPPLEVLPKANVNCHKYALLIGGDNGYGVGVPYTFLNDLSHTYCALVEHGYMKENIYVLAGDGTASSNAMNSLNLDGLEGDEIRHEICNGNNVRNAVNKLKEQLRSSDMLYIYFAGHGEGYGENWGENVLFRLWEFEPLYDTTFANMLSGIDCAQIFVNLFSCYSGGFENDLSNLSTSAKKTLLAHYAEAIDWYEHAINDTATSYNDSLFARIDMMELYMKIGQNRNQNFSQIDQLALSSPCLTRCIEQDMLSLLPKNEMVDQMPTQAQDDHYLPVRNLDFANLNDTLFLFWDLPEIFSDEIRLSWANPHYYDNAYQSYVQWRECAHRFDTIDLKPFIGWRIKDVSYHTYECNKEYETFSMKIWTCSPGSVDTETIFDSIIINPENHQWHTIQPDTNIYITEGCELWVGYHYAVSSPGVYGYPFSLDGGPETVEGKGNWERNNGIPSWQTTYLFNQNQLISATIENPAGETLQIGTRTSPQLTGFRIYRDGSLIADLPHPIRTFYTDDFFAKDNIVEYCVTSVYDDEIESNPMCVTAEFVEIDEKKEYSYTISPNPVRGIVRINGGDVSEIQLYNNLGQLVRTVFNTNSIDLSDLTKGLYFLLIQSETRSEIQKIVVR